MSCSHLAILVAAHPGWPYWGFPWPILKERPLMASPTAPTCQASLCCRGCTPNNPPIGGSTGCACHPAGSESNSPECSSHVRQALASLFYIPSSSSCKDFRPTKMLDRFSDTTPWAIPRAHLAAFGDIFNCHNRGGCGIGLYWTEAWDGATHLTQDNPPQQRII